MSMISKALSLVGVGGSMSASLDPGLPARSGGGFMRGGRGVVFSGWRPSLRDHNEVVGESWDVAAARAMDSIINSGWLSGAIEQGVANTIGTGLRLKCRPENDMFGMSDEAAQAFARVVESRFELWGSNPQECDIEGMRTFGQMQAAAFRMWYATGEVLAELPWRRRPWNISGTKLRVMPPHRIARASDPFRRLVNGVFLDMDGMPIGYRACRKDPVLGIAEYNVRARDPYGRPNIIHLFEGMPDTHRGIGPLTPVLQVVKQFDQLADATLTAAILQTMFAATITSETPTEEILDGLLTPQERAQTAANGSSAVDMWLDATAGYYDAATINTGINGRVGHLFPGDKMEFLSANLPGIDYKSFVMQLLREIARALGMTYESATGDYGGSSYYTIGSSNSEIYGITKARRANVIAPMCQAVYEAWLEEEIESGRIAFPGGVEAFLRNRASVCRSEWRGSPKLQADDLKTAKAAETRKRLGIASDQMLADEWGTDDIEDIYDARAREMALRRKYDLPEPMLMAGNGGKADTAPNGGNQVGDAADGEGD